MQPQVLFALLDRAEFETICLTICNPALKRFGNRNASASRVMRALRDLVKRHDLPGICRFLSTECFEAALAGLIEVIDDPCSTLDATRFPYAPSNGGHDY
jgi:hypothetical protein